MPNVVLVIGDDQDYRDFGFMGSPLVQTPNLDTLAAGGTVFTSALNTASVCAASLLSILTGIQPRRWELEIDRLRRDGGNPDRPFQELRRAWVRQAQTLPRLLATRGYASFEGGKYWEDTFESGGFSAGMSTEETLRVPMLFAGGGWLTLGRETMQPVYDFIDEHRNDRFFVWFAPAIPHLPHNAPQEYRELYADRGLSPAAREYYANCSWLDGLVGELMAFLDERQLRSNTLVVFLSDNGWQQRPDEPNGSARGLGGLHGKLSMYDPGFRTPIVFSWPGRVPEGRSVDALVSTLDLMPTILEYAGIEPPEHLPGRSLLGLIAGGSGPIRESIIGSMSDVRSATFHVPGNPVENRAPAYFLRTPEWHYIWYAKEGSEELYRPGDDPDEEHDLATEHPDLLRQFRGEVERWRSELEAP